jgi:tetratricopeptide (TPR) repeat protein
MSSLLDRLLEVAKDFESQRFAEQVENKKELRALEQQVRTLRETSQHRLDEISFLKGQLDNAHDEIESLRKAKESKKLSGDDERVSLIREVVALRFIVADLVEANSNLAKKDKENETQNSSDLAPIYTPPEKVRTVPSRQAFFDAAAGGDKAKLLSILEPGVTFQEEFIDVMNKALVKGCGMAPGEESPSKKRLQQSGVLSDNQTASKAEDEAMEILDVLLAAGATVEGAQNKNAKHSTPLHAAASSGSGMLVESLLSQEGVDVNATNKSGQTALHAASLNAGQKSGVASVAKGLLMAGCDLSIKDSEGLTAMDVLETSLKKYTESPEAGELMADNVRKTIETFKDPTVRFWNCSVRAFDAYSGEQFEEAVEVYAESIDLVKEFGLPVSKEDCSRLYYNRARALCHLNERTKAVTDLDFALELAPEYTNARALLAQSQFELFQYDRCVQNVKIVLERDPGNVKWKKLLAEARKLRDASHYDVLGIDRSADENTIKKAYRRGSIKWHPDKHQNHPDNTARANTMFKRVNEANQVLGDSYKKLLYDVELDREIEEQLRHVSAAPRGHAPSSFEPRRPHAPASASKGGSRASAAGSRDIFNEIYTRRDMEEEFNNWQRVSVDTAGAGLTDDDGSDYYDDDEEEEIFGY